MDGTRTRDPLRDRQVFKPAELPHHFVWLLSFSIAVAKVRLLFESASVSRKKFQKNRVFEVKSPIEPLPTVFNFPYPIRITLHHFEDICATLS